MAIVPSLVLWVAGSAATNLQFYSLPTITQSFVITHMTAVNNHQAKIVYPMIKNLLSNNVMCDM
jgi:hypothetical protein